MSESIQLYGGEILLDFDPVHHKYFISENGKRFLVPSVTQCIDLIDHSGPLTQWSANATVDALREQILPGQAYDEVQLEAIFEHARFNFRRIAKRAKSVGSLAHEWIKAYLKGERKEMPVNEQARNACQAAKAWLDEHFLMCKAEMQVYSRKYKYAGTLDTVGYVDTWLSLVEWKTSAAIYPEYALQAAAYKHAVIEMGVLGEDVSSLLPSIQDRWIVRLGKEDGAFEAVKLPRGQQGKDFKAFLGAKALWERLRRNGQPSTKGVKKDEPRGTVEAMAALDELED